LLLTYDGTDYDSCRRPRKRVDAGYKVVKVMKANSGNAETISVPCEGFSWNTVCPIGSTGPLSYAHDGERLLIDL
jgi:hypothetical protein